MIRFVEEDIRDGKDGPSILATGLNVLQSREEFLRKQNIVFTDRDITSDESALAELEKLGVLTTPVVDRDMIVGYDINRLKTLLGL